MSLQGRIETFFMASLLQLLSNDKKTGVLEVSDGEKIIKVFFRDGTIVHATGSKKEERLGFLLRSEGIISSEDIDSCLSLSRQTNQRLGKILLEKGLITLDTLTNFIQMQAEIILYGLFLWKSGYFEYRDTPVDLENEIVTSLDTMELILEASRRVDELSVLTEHFPKSGQILEQTATSTRPDDIAKLTENEKAVLDLIDGHKTIKKIVEESGYDEFSVYKILFSLVSSCLIEIKDSPKTPAVDHSNRPALERSTPGSPVPGGFRPAAEPEGESISPKNFFADIDISPLDEEPSAEITPPGDADATPASRSEDSGQDATGEPHQPSIDTIHIIPEEEHPDTQFPSAESGKEDDAGASPYSDGDGFLLESLQDTIVIQDDMSPERDIHLQSGTSAGPVSEEPSGDFQHQVPADTPVQEPPQDSSATLEPSAETPSDIQEPYDGPVVTTLISQHISSPKKHYIIAACASAAFVIIGIAVLMLSFGTPPAGKHVSDAPRQTTPAKKQPAPTPSPPPETKKKATPPPQAEALKPVKSDTETGRTADLYQDPLGHFSVILPPGYTVNRKAAGSKTRTTFVYSPLLKVFVVYWQLQEDWNAEDEMFYKVVAIKEGSSTYSHLDIDRYGLVSLADSSGYEISLSSGRGYSASKAHLYALVRGNRAAVVELYARRIGSPDTLNTFSRINDAVRTSFFLLP